jgi:hypothetical protein
MLATNYEMQTILRPMVAGDRMLWTAFDIGEMRGRLPAQDRILPCFHLRLM